MVSVLLAGLGLLCWPQRSGALPRPGDALPAAAAVTGRPLPSPATLLATVIVAAVLAVAVTFGWMVGLSAALALGTLALLARTELSRRRDQRDLTEILAATRTLAREVKSGAAPAAAISSTAAAHGGRAAQVLEELAIGVARDRVGSAARPPPGAPPRGVAAEISDRLARSWSLSARYGVPLAALIEATSVDLADRVRARSQLDAQVSGPRMSGYLLAAMPALGVVLGTGMGAEPVRVLLGGGLGNLMLLVGSTLTCAGLLWTAKIVRR